MLRPLRHEHAEADATSLIANFGSLGAVLSGDAADLAGILDDREAAEHLVAVAAASIQAFRAEVHAQPVLSTSEAVASYLRAVMGSAVEEQLRVLFLDAQNRLLREEVIGNGSTREVPIYPRNIMRRALALGSTALILVHNHPSGSSEPSAGDLDATRRLILVARELEIVVHDHLIVTRAAVTSLRVRGLI